MGELKLKLKLRAPLEVLPGIRVRSQDVQQLCVSGQPKTFGLCSAKKSSRFVNPAVHCRGSPRGNPKPQVEPQEPKPVGSRQNSSIVFQRCGRGL